MTLYVHILKQATFGSGDQIVYIYKKKIARNLEWIPQYNFA